MAQSQADADGDFGEPVEEQRLELDLPRSRGSVPSSPSSSGRGVLPPAGDDTFEAIATPLSGRGRLPSRDDIELGDSPPSKVGQEASLAPPPLGSAIDAEPPVRPRAPRPSAPSIDLATARISSPERASAPDREPAPRASLPPEGGRHLGQVLRLPVGLIVGGLVVMAIDRGAADSFSGSPIRPIWVSMTMLIVGLGMVFWRLLAIDSEH